MGAPLHRRSLSSSQGGARASTAKTPRCSQPAGLFNHKWRIYASMDQDLHLEALNRAEPGSWTGVALGSKTSHDKVAAMALALDRFDDSPVQTHESEAWFTMMAQQYILLGRRLEGKSQAQVLQDGQDLVVQDAKLLQWPSTKCSRPRPRPGHSRRFS